MNEFTRDLVNHAAEHIESTPAYHVVRPVVHRLYGQPVEKALAVSTYYGAVRTTVIVGGQYEHLDMDPIQAAAYGRLLIQRAADLAADTPAAPVALPIASAGAAGSTEVGAA